MKKDYATLIGVAMSAVDYIESLYVEGKTIDDWDYDCFFSEWHGVYDWN